jgi:hypothetical protein
MKPQSAKAKGRKLQQTVRDAVLKTFPDLTERDVKSTGMGQAGDDLQLSEKAFKLFPYCVEAKNMARVVIYKWFKQRIPKEGQVLLVIKQNHDEPLAIITLKHFMELIRGKT